MVTVSQPSSSVLFFWDSVKVNFQCDTELPHLTTGKPGNAILPRKFSHEFAKPGVFLWVPEQLQQTLIPEIVIRRFWERWVASADKHHQWCQQSRFVFRQARAMEASQEGSRGRGKSFFLISKAAGPFVCKFKAIWTSKSHWIQFTTSTKNFEY